MIVDKKTTWIRTNKNGVYPWYKEESGSKISEGQWYLCIAMMKRR